MVLNSVNNPALFLHYREIILTNAAKWAYPVIGYFLECSSWGNASIWVSVYGIIDVPANVTNILFNIAIILKVKLLISKYINRCKSHEMMCL